MATLDGVVRSAGEEPPPTTRAGSSALGRLLPRASGRRARKRMRPLELGIGLVSVTLVSLLWQYAPEVLGVSVHTVPRLSTVAETLWNGLRDGTFTDHAQFTFTASLFGFAIAVVLGIVSGTLVALFPVANYALKPYLIALHSTPKIALAPVLIIVLGVGMESKVAVAALVGWMPVMVNVIAGLQNTDPSYLQLLRSMGASNMQLMRFVRVPNAIPHVVAGLQSGALLSLLGAVAAEFIASDQGLGYYMRARMTVLDTRSVYAAMVLLSLIGITYYWLLNWMGRRVVFWTE